MGELVSLGPRDKRMPDKVDKDAYLDAQPGINRDFLLPILFIFMLGKKGYTGGIFNNLNRVIDNVSSMFKNINLSSDSLENMLRAVNAVGPYMSANNMVIVDRFAVFLEALHKISVVRELRDKLTGTSYHGFRTPLTFNSKKEKILHMIDTMEEFFDEDTKEGIKKFKTTINMIDGMKDIGRIINEKKINKDKMELADMMEILSPLIKNNDQFKNLEKIQNMMKMAEIMSVLDEEDDDEEYEDLEVNENDGKNKISLDSIDYEIDDE